MSPTTLEKPIFISADETTIVVKVNLDESDAYRSCQLCWKQYPQSWQECQSKVIPIANTAVTMEATDLLPATTYCLRLEAKDGSGVVSEDLIVDTEAVSCTPQARSCCVIQ